MRCVLPHYGKVSEDDINCIISEANGRCLQEQRESIADEDIFWAMRKLGFDDLVEHLHLRLVIRRLPDEPPGPHADRAPDILDSDEYEEWIG